MADEPEVAPTIEAEPTPAAPTPETPVAAAPEAPETPEPAPAPEEPKHKPWFQTRIDGLTAEKYQLKQALEEAQRQLDAFAALNRAEPTPPAPTPPERTSAPPQTDIDRLAAERAEQIVRTREFNAICDATYQKGEKAFGKEFQGAVANLNSAGVISQDNMSFLEAAMATEAPEQVIYSLGNNPEEAMRVASMTPTRMAIELDRMARELSKPAPVSNLPPPITPVNGARQTAAFDEGDTKVDLKTWLAEREKQVAARKAARF